MFIISPLQSTEDQIAAVTQRVVQVITGAGGEVAATENSSPWGRRKFAYAIREYAEGEPSRRNFTEGFYVLVTFTAPATAVAVVERALKLNDSVLRFLLTLVETKAKAADAPAESVASTSEPA
jgi:small subunit ribosomal protein S6